MLDVVMVAPESELPQEGPEASGQPSRGRVAAPRLSKQVVRLDDGHRVQVSIAGRGVPFVLVHGFTADGILYAQTLSRLVGSGFKVIAVDAAGHGGTGGISLDGGAELARHAELLHRVIDHLGVKRAVFAGHSMGGRIVTELAARHPRRAIGVILLDAIVGDTWDRRVAMSRVVPPLMGATGAVLAVDTVSTVPFLRDPRQALKLGRLFAPVWLRNARRPWGIVGAGISIMRSGPSSWMLDRLADQLVHVYVIHGDRDVAVPLATARDAARRAKGELIVVHGATHSWLLKDPETFPAIVGELLADTLGEACRIAVTAEGLPLDDETIDGIESVLYEEGSLAVELTPALDLEPMTTRHRRPRYRWTRTSPR
jgi:pimeloyl-ACP methyl ester carboxylesterase